MKKAKAKRITHSYSADRPIRSKKDDLLGRAGFSARLANDIREWKADDSLVIALYGDWGSGKSSVKNMLLEELGVKRTKRPHIVEFNPWQLSGTGGIIVSFFHELGVALGKAGPIGDVEKRAKRLSAYSSGLAIGGTALKTIGAVMPWVGIPAGPAVQMVGEGIKAMSSASKEGSDALKAKGEAETKSLNELKREVSALLAKLREPVLIIIDDIERLTTDEILQIFQLVKANADFPKVIYLLLFERSVVAKALDKVSGDRGDEFMEKIVQVGFHIPHASNRAVHKVLFAELDSLIGQAPVAKHWDKHHWSDLYGDGISGYFQNLRHVLRFLASFAFNVRTHTHGDSFEVNPVDLIGLEVLRVFEPAVYERLPGAKRILTRYEGLSLFGSIEQAVVDQALTQILSYAAPASRERVKAVLNVLFPALSSAYQGRRDMSHDHESWLRELRVCHPDLFDKYFTLTVADDDVSQAELDRLLSLTGDASGFRVACEALNERGLLNVAFRRLDAYREQIPLSNLPPLIKALCDMGDTWAEKRPLPLERMFEHDPSAYAWRFCYFGLRRESDRKKRFQILNESISQSQGVSFPFELVSLEDRAVNEASGHEFLLDEPDVETLKQVCIRKFRSAAANRAIRQIPQIGTIISRWGSWESKEEVKSFMSGLIQTPEDAVWLTASLLGESHSYGQEHKVRYSIALGLLERFADIDRLKDLLSKLGKSKLTKREGIALREFEKALKRREEGQPDIVGRQRDDPDEEVLE